MRHRKHELLEGRPTIPIPVPEGTKAALLEALAAHRQAEAAYAAVLARFGPVQPFLDTVEAQRRREESLKALFQARGLEVPAAPTEGPAAALPQTLPEACAAGAKREEAIIAMYDRLLSQAHRADVRALFHCASGNRMGGALYAYWMPDEHRAPEEALALARKVGLRNPATEAAVKAYVERHRGPQS